MSRLDDLIKELCPNGVAFSSLKDCTILGAGERITTAMMDDSYQFPVMGGGTVPTGKFNAYNFENCVTISRAGSAGYVNWLGEKFWATDVCFVATQKENGPIIKYVYYYVKSKESELQKKIYGGNLPKLNKDYLWNLMIPVPPLPIQEEIVRILDNFTELTAELTAELTDRKKQYEYYRNSLLEFKKDDTKIGRMIKELCPNGVEFNILNEVCKLQNGFAFKSNLFKTEGLPVLKITNISDGKISDENLAFFSKLDYDEELSNYEVKKGDVVIAMSGATTGKIGYNCSNTIYYLNQRVGLFKPNEKKLNKRYLYHWLLSQSNNILRISSGTGAQPNLSSTKMMEFKIPVPPKPIQDEIVKILDSFSEYIGDNKQGLINEIEMRKKQYEYYRDKLLTFKRLN